MFYAGEGMEIIEFSSPPKLEKPGTPMLLQRACRIQASKQKEFLR